MQKTETDLVVVPDSSAEDEIRQRKKFGWSVKSYQVVSTVRERPNPNGGTDRETEHKTHIVFERPLAFPQRDRLIVLEKLRKAENSKMFFRMLLVVIIIFLIHYAIIEAVGNSEELQKVMLVCYGVAVFVLLIRSGGRKVEFEKEAAEILEKAGCNVE